MLRLRAIDLDMSQQVWTLRPLHHKTSHRGLTRTVYFGPRAQAVIRPFLKNRPVGAFLFSAAEAEEEHRAAILREEIARVMPEILHPPEGRALPGPARDAGKKNKRKGKRR